MAPSVAAAKRTICLLALLGSSLAQTATSFPFRSARVLRFARCGEVALSCPLTHAAVIPQVDRWGQEPSGPEPTWSGYCFGGHHLTTGMPYDSSRSETVARLLRWSRTHTMLSDRWAIISCRGSPAAPQRPTPQLSLPHLEGRCWLAPPINCHKALLEVFSFHKLLMLFLCEHYNLNPIFWRSLTNN